ncbi:MAG: hypothetical protein AB7S39_20625 [Gemmatimonadales bacterium]
MIPALLALLQAPCPAPSGGVRIPTDYLADRWVARVPGPDGKPIRFYLDTGGGTNMLYRTGTARLGITPDSVAGGPPGAGQVPAEAVPVPGAFPPFEAHPDGPVRLLVPPPNPQFEQETDGPMDGFLGRTWFADRAWTFDYPARALHYHASLSGGGPDRCWVPLGFQTDSAGRRTTHFPRVEASVDGETLQFLFDTGAMTTLTDSALALLPGGPGRRGTSFITASVVERWRTKHPDWRYLPRAETGTGAAMIEVPEVVIGGVTVGPVWFTVRPDRAFHDFMSQWMDRKLDGALGGSAFRELSVTIDYPGARAMFVKPAAGR